MTRYLVFRDNPAGDTWETTNAVDADNPERAIRIGVGVNHSTAINAGTYVAVPVDELSQFFDRYPRVRVTAHVDVVAPEAKA